MNALIIGGAGFVGKYLLRHLNQEYPWNLYVTKLPNENINEKEVQVYNLDITDKSAIVDVLKKVQPDYIFHLAAQSSVAFSWKNPNFTVDINIKGCLNLLDAVRDCKITPKILLIGSGEEYGRIHSDELPLNEFVLPRPGNIYAATKVCQNIIGNIYADAYNMDIILVRAFNHIGPGQAPAFVASDFCRQVALIEKGLHEPIMKVGNLGARRDFTDVRDVVRAYGMLIQKGKKGETYNIGSGKAVAIQSILDCILSLSTKKIDVEIDPSKLRPIDIPVIEADTNKITDCTGWKPQIKLEQTLKETLDYWRHII